jgi:tight adherence protein C
VSAGALAAWLAAVLAAAAVTQLAALPRGRVRGRPAVLVALLVRVGGRLGVAPAPGDLARRLAAAGVRPAIGPGDVMAAKTGAALLAALAAGGPAAALPGRLGPLALLAAPVGGFLAPDLVLRRRAGRRARVMARELADVLDLLRICVEAGRSPARALAEVGRRHRGLLGRELRRAARELALGRPRAQALDQLAARCPVPEIAALVAAIGRADRHGAPLGPALAALAADARADRSRAVREQASRAAPKIQLVVALLLVPAVMLLVAAALAAALGAT